MAQLTGERIQQRVARVPGSLTMITARGAMPESSLKSLRQIQGEVVPRHNVPVVWKPAVADKRRNASNRTRETRAMVAVSCRRRAAGEKILVQIGPTLTSTQVAVMR